MKYVGVAVIVCVAVGMAAAEPGGSASQPEAVRSVDAAADAVKEWSIEAPAGWHESVEQAQALIHQQQSSLFGPKRLDARVWLEPNRRGALFAVKAVIDRHDDAMRQIDAFDGGFVPNFIRSLNRPTGGRVDRLQRIVGNMVIRDLTVEVTYKQVFQARLVRWYQPADDGLHALTVSCMEPTGGQLCGGVIDSVRFSVAHPTSLHRTPTSEATDENHGNAPFEVGEWIGYSIGVNFALGVIVAVPTLLVLWLVLRQRWTRRRGTT